MISDYHGPKGRYPCEHRGEDFPLIQSVIREFKPTIAVELGTGWGGFLALLADTLSEWGGVALGFDRKRREGDDLDRVLRDFSNAWFYEEDIRPVGPHGETLLNGKVVALLSSSGAMLYAANGDPAAELELYAPHCRGALIGQHDYAASWGDRERAERAALHAGFVPHRHEEFAALAHDGYKIVGTRFWRRA